MANIRHFGKRKRGRKESEKDKEINYVLEKIHHYPDKIRFKIFAKNPPINKKRVKNIRIFKSSNLNQF